MNQIPWTFLVSFLVGFTTAPPCHALPLVSSILAWFSHSLSLTVPFSFFFLWLFFFCSLFKYWNLRVFCFDFFLHNFTSSHLIQSHGSAYHFFTNNSRVFNFSPELSLELHTCIVYGLLDTLWKPTRLAATSYTSCPKSKALFVLSWQISSPSSCIPSLGRWHRVRRIKFFLSFSSVPYLNQLIKF